MENINLYHSLVEKLNLSSDDTLFIASDITKLALAYRKKGVRFNANDFIESFQNVLHNGTIVIPAYTDYLKDGDTFDYQNSKPSTGALSNKVKRRKDFMRSFDPLHSVFVWGKLTNEVVRLDADSSLGKGSVFEVLHREKAKMICIDVDFQNSLTFVHYVEELRKVSYRKEYHWKMRIKEGEQLRIKNILFYTRKLGTETHLKRLQQDAVKAGVVKEIPFLQSTILYFDLDELYRFINQYLDGGKKLYFFCPKTYIKNLIKKIINRK